MAGSIHRKPQNTTGAAQGGTKINHKPAPAMPSQYAISKNDVKPEVTSSGTVHKKATHYKIAK